MMIVANDVIYQKIVTPVWVAMLILTFVYFVFCVQKSLVFDEKILEDYTYETFTGSKKLTTKLLNESIVV